VIIAEFAGGIVLSAALGFYVLFRQQSFWQIVIGSYLISLGVNYLPMFAYAVSFPTRESARMELADELADKRKAMSKYRRLSLLLLIPLLVPILAFAARKRAR
jgi:hypothetical protein